MMRRQSQALDAGGGDRGAVRIGGAQGADAGGGDRGAVRIGGAQGADAGGCGARAQVVIPFNVAPTARYYAS